jgi:hypothetical protein
MIDSNPNKVYSEVEGMQMLLKYKVMNAGCCKILLVRDCYILTGFIFLSVPHSLFCILVNRFHTCDILALAKHPQWGSSVYPASLFTTAPEEVASRLLQSMISGNCAES